MTKILLVEDDKNLREIYGVRLLAEGYDIVSAGDGEEALAMAIKDRPALIVSDVMMPKISGFDMLDILRSTTETRNIKVIMMTALSSEDQRKRGEQLGADKYLVKSQVGIEDVVRAVHEVLEDMPGVGAKPTPTPSPAPAASQPNSDAAPPATPTPSPAPTPAPVAPAPQPQPRPLSGPIPSPRPASPATTPPANSTPPAPASTPTPVSTPAPAAPSPAPASTDSTLPKPTAPFSTQRPANLGDRIIQPLEHPTEEGVSIGDRIDAVLDTSDMPAPSEPLVPAPSAPTAPAASSAPSTDLSYEETPPTTRQDSPSAPPPAL